MTPADYKDLAAVAAFLAAVVKGCTWVADRFDATAKRSIATAVDGLKYALAETATDLRQGIDGVKEEIAELRTDLHALNDRTVNHEARLVTLEQFDTIAARKPAKKVARRKTA